jgi:hypothetical protein
VAPQSQSPARRHSITSPQQAKAILGVQDAKAKLATAVNSGLKGPKASPRTLSKRQREEVRLLVEALDAIMDPGKEEGKKKHSHSTQSIKERRLSRGAM